MITCYIDGSCRYNPHGEMGFSFIIELTDLETIKFNDSIPARFGNSSVAAEYKALEMLLIKLIELKVVNEEIIINTDCTLIYRQFNHEVKNRKGYYLELAFEVARLAKRFRHLKINWIPRNENVEADVLASRYYSS